MEKFELLKPYEMTNKTSLEEISKIGESIDKIFETYPRNFSTEECSQLMKRPLDLNDESLLRYTNMFYSMTPESVKE